MGFTFWCLDFVVCSEHFKKCYLLLNGYEETEPIKRKTWNDLGSGVCEKYGWSLISIHTKDENDFMGELLLQRYYDVDNRHIYIGNEFLIKRAST